MEHIFGFSHFEVVWLETFPGSSPCDDWNRGTVIIWRKIPNLIGYCKGNPSKMTSNIWYQVWSPPKWVAFNDHCKMCVPLEGIYKWIWIPLSEKEHHLQNDVGRLCSFQRTEHGSFWDFECTRQAVCFSGVSSTSMSWLSSQKTPQTNFLMWSWKRHPISLRGCWCSM